jgi:tetratricopeptide (TPR) repeat protein
MSTTARAVLVMAALLVVTAVLLWDSPAPAQIPDKFTNLEVLPKDIGKRELVGAMRGISMGLGVRCDFCHVESGDHMDFASDEKEHKRTARAMMRMVDEINGTLIPKAGMDSPARVQCVTCHHGVTEPQTLDHLLLDVMEKDGFAGAEAKYRELRDEYYGSASYDFTPTTLNALAEAVAQDKGDADGAISVVKLNLEFYPEDARTHLLLGQLYAQKGDTDAAITSIERSLELDPGNEWAQRTLEQVKGQKKD